MRRPLLLIIVAGALAAQLLLLLPLPYLVQAAAAFALVGILPGVLLVALLFGPLKHIEQQFPSQELSWTDVDNLERLVYAVGLGFTSSVVVMLCLSYLPGGLARWQVLVAFDLLIVVLLVLIAIRGENSTRRQPLQAQKISTPVLGALILLLAVAAFLRLTNLGYHEFHNDEARAALRAAAVIQGFEETLLIHKKGPTEILVPTAIYALTGRLTEAGARLPFALANLTGLLAIFLLGRQLFAYKKFGTTVGLVAMLLLTFDGYFIGFARIVQYQSIVFLTSTLVLLVLSKLVQKPLAQYPELIQPHLCLAALLLATGLLAHYEAALILLPALLLWGVLLWRNPPQRPQIMAASGIGALLGALLLGLFYIPYVRHPQFGATYTYLIERRIGIGSTSVESADIASIFPYNNLADVFLRTTLYSSTYYVAALTLLTVLALLILYWRNLGQVVGTLLAFALAATLSSAFFQPQWFIVDGRDLTVLPFLIAIGIVLILPKVSVEERVLWLWFGGLFLLAIFFTLKPRTHVYVFFLPWVLLAGWAVARIGRWIDRRWKYPTALMAAGGAALLLSLLFGNYAYRYFVQNSPEVLRTWEQNRPAGYWTAYAQPDKRALFGFPSNNGWKTIGALYEQGILSGSYYSNELEAWGPSWYTRGAERCRIAADWYFQTTGNLEPFYDFQRVAMEDYLSKGFQPWGMVEVNGVHKMTIHKRTDDQQSDEAVTNLPIFRLEEYAQGFDANARATLPLTYPAVNAEIVNPLHVNMADLLWLEGYNIDYVRPLEPGSTINLTLFWRAQRATNETYKVFIQSFYGNGTMVAQRDAYPVCGNRDTWQWDPGELITDIHKIEVKANAPDGLYPLFAGMYLEQSGSRLDVIDAEGNVVGDWIHLTDIRVGVE